MPDPIILDYDDEFSNANKRTYSPEMRDKLRETFTKLNSLAKDANVSIVTAKALPTAEDRIPYDPDEMEELTRILGTGSEVAFRGYQELGGKIKLITCDFVQHSTLQ